MVHECEFDFCQLTKTAVYFETSIKCSVFPSYIQQMISDSMQYDVCSLLAK